MTGRKRPVIIYGGGTAMAPKRNVFLGKYFTDPTIKKPKFGFSTTSNIN
jgi:hypothetical protein